MKMEGEATKDHVIEIYQYQSRRINVADCGSVGWDGGSEVKWRKGEKRADMVA